MRKIDFLSTLGIDLDHPFSSTKRRPRNSWLRVTVRALVTPASPVSHSLALSMSTCQSSSSNFRKALQITSRTGPRFIGLIEFQREYTYQRSRKCRAVSSSFDGTRWSHSRKNLLSNTANNTGSSTDDGLEDEKEEERKVHCEVEVISWRERRIKAEISVHADVGSVWNALTDYERLADFIPNLVRR